MKNSKRIVTSLLGIVLSAGILAGCGTTTDNPDEKKKEEVVHHFGETLSSDATGHWYPCTDSGCSEKKDFAAHVFGEWGVKTSATFEKAGVEARKCNVCNFEETRPINKLEHTYASTWSSDANKHWHACTDAGFTSLKRDEANHIAGNWEVKTAASYDAAGVEVKKCTVCGQEMETRPISKLEHKYANTWSSDANKHWHACTDVGFTGLKKDEASHNHNTIKKNATDPTETSTGLTAVTACSVCGKEFAGTTIPALTEKDYTVSYALETIESVKTEVKTWTLKDQSVLGALTFKTSKTGMEIIKIGDNEYTVNTLNIDGLTMSVVEGTIVLTATKEVTINGAVSATYPVKLTGSKMTFVGDGLTDGFNIKQKDLTIDCDVNFKLGTPDDTNTLSGVVCNNLIVNEGAKITVDDYQYGVYIFVNANVNGSADVMGRTQGIYSASTGNQYIVVKDGNILYSDGVEIENNRLVHGANTVGRHVEVYPAEAGVHDHNNFKISNLVAPTFEATGSADIICGGAHESTNKHVTLPILNNVDYTISARTYKDDTDGLVYDASTYTIVVDGAEFLIDADRKQVVNYIQCGSSFYSVDAFNTLYTNQHAVVSDNAGVKTLTITLNGDIALTASDGESPLDGTLDLHLYNKVVIDGNGTFDVAYSSLQDGILANELEIGEHVVVKLVGASKTEKSGIKCLVGMTINGKVEVSNFGYAHAIADNNSFITIASTGTYDIHDCKNGLYTWKDLTLNVYGVLNIRDAAGCGIGTTSNANVWNHIYFHGNSKVSIITGDTAICRFQDLIIGDGDKGATKNNAEVYLESSSKAAIVATRSSSCVITLLFNSSKETYVKGGAGCMTLDQGKHHLLFLTNVTFESTGNQAIWCSNYNGNDYPEIVYDNANPTIKLVGCTSFAAGAKNGSLAKAVTEFRS